MQAQMDALKNKMQAQQDKLGEMDSGESSDSDTDQDSNSESAAA